MRVIALGLLAVMSSCLEFERVIATIDLANRRATFSFRMISSNDPAYDASTLKKWLDPKESLAAIEERLGLYRYAVTKREVTQVNSHLDGELAITFETPADIGLDHYDAARPVRYCPPKGLVIVASNAQYRDDRNCVLWGKGVKTLRLELVPLSTPYDPRPLFEAYKALVRK